MASLQKTFTGDLTTAIAGKLYEAIRDADNKNDQTDASEDVKKAATEVKQEDPDSIPVKDMDLRETIVNFFTPIDRKLLKAQVTYNAISSKVTALAGGVADTQKLLINQNQILEDKFDQILSVIGTKNALEAKLKAENDFKQLELNLEKGLDLSGTVAYDKAGGRSSMGLLGSVLQGILGNRMTARLVRNLYKKIVPKGLRARARLLRKTVRPFGKVTRFALTPLKAGVRGAVLASTKVMINSLLNIGKKNILGRRGLRAVGRALLTDVPDAGIRVGGKAAKRSLSAVGRKYFGFGLGKLGFAMQNLIGRGQMLMFGRTNADRIASEILNAYATRATLLRNASEAQKLLGKTFKGAKQLSILEDILKPGRSAAVAGKGAAGSVKAGRKIVKEMADSKASTNAATSLANDILGSKGLFKYLKNPVIQKKLAKKLGPEGLEKLLTKAGVAGVKNVAIGPGTIYSFVEGLARISPLFGGSDPTGMFLSFGSAVPYAGWGVIMADILRDIDRQAFDAHILPNLIPWRVTEENFQDFFTQALGLEANQFERGTPNISRNMLGDGGVDSISEILGVTKAFGQATGFGAEVGGLIGEAGLGSYPVGKSDYIFDVSGDIGGGKGGKAKQAKEIELRERQRYKEEKKDEEEEEDDEEEEEIKTRRKDGLPEGENQWWDWFDQFANPAAGEGGGNLLARVSRDKKKSGIPQSVLDANPHLDPTKPGDYIKLKRMQPPVDKAINSKTPMMGIGGPSTIEFHGQQGRDRSGEPGVDFSFQDYKNNYNLFPGYVLETGLLYGKGYGNVVVVRSIDPSNGRQFDALYSHFPDGGIAVKPGQQVGAGDLLGSVGFVNVDTPGVPQLQPLNAGNMSGWHTSVDFFEPGSAARYSNADKLINLVVGGEGSTPNGLLQRLKPPTTNGDTSSLNRIEANSNLASTMTNLVENGSSERLMTKRQASKPLPIVIINNQTVNTNQNLISFGAVQEESNFFEAYNLARHTV